MYIIILYHCVQYVGINAWKSSHPLRRCDRKAFSHITGDGTLASKGLNQIQQCCPQVTSVTGEVQGKFVWNINSNLHSAHILYSFAGHIGAIYSQRCMQLPYPATKISFQMSFAYGIHKPKKMLSKKNTTMSLRSPDQTFCFLGRRMWIIAKRSETYQSTC